MTKVTPERSRRSVKPPERFLNDYLLEKSFSSEKYEKTTTLGKILKSKSAKGTCETIFQCNICGNELSSKHNLESHIASVHEGKKPHQCSICKKKFTQKGKVTIIQVGLRMTSRLAGVLFAIQKGSFKHNLICLS